MQTRTKRLHSTATNRSNGEGFMQKTKSKFLTLFLIACLVSQAFLFWVPNILPNAYASGESWLTGWAYRKSHVINNATGAGTNYQVKIYVWNSTGTSSGDNVSLGNNVLSASFGDIRFTDDDGSTLLDCWLESVNSTTAIFWVEVADSLESAAQTIYVYYGKADATTTSNGVNTFILFDHFDDSSFDTTKWTVSHLNHNGTVSESGTEVTVSSGATSGDHTAITDKATHATPCALEYRVKATDGYGAKEIGFDSVVIGELDKRKTIGWFAHVTAFTTFFGISGNESAAVYPTFTAAKDTNYHRGSILRTGISNDVFICDGESIAGTKYCNTARYVEADVYAVANKAGVIVIDWVALRKYCSPEPAHSTWDAEESYGQKNVYAKYHSTSSDGYLTNSSTVYVTCNTGDTGTVTNTTSDLYVGQKSDNSSYQTLRPNAAGDLTEWTPSAGSNYQCIDETTSDDDTTYVYGGVNIQDLYNVDNNGLAPDIFAHISIVAVAKAATQPGNLTIMMKTDGTIYESSVIALTTAYVTYRNNWTLNPKYGYAWNDTSLDALQIGINSSVTSGFGVVRVTQMYVEVYYVTYTDYRSAVYISASGIPDNAVLVNAALYVYVATDNTETNFNLWVMNSTDGTYPSDPLATTSFNKTNYQNAGGSVSTTGAGWLTITFNSTGLAMISKTGTTKLFLISNRDYAGTAPGITGTTDTEYVIISSKEATETQNPYLLVTWRGGLPQTIYADEISAAESNWNVQGTNPYLDDSSVNYIESYTATNSSWFTFPDLLSDLPQQVWLEVEAQTGATASYCQIIMDEGTTNYTIATVCFGRFTAWKSYNVTTKLNTLAKLNATKIKFNSLNATTGYGSRIYRLRLRLFSGPCPYNDTSKIGATTPEVSTTTTFYCYWQDSDNLSSASVTHNCTGTFTTTNTTLSTSAGWSNFTATTPSNSTYNVVYWFNANDTNNYWERTENYTLKLLWPSYDPTAYNKVDNDTGTLAHSLGRQAFFDSVTNLYWVKYFKLNASSLWNLDWATSSDGKAWTHRGTIKENATVTDAGSGFTYWLVEQRGGVSYCHIQYGNEAVNSSIYYRRGLLNSDGTITFTAWQTAVTGPANQKICVEGFAVSPSGHVWIEYECDAGGGSYSFGYGNITLSTATDGTWSTHTSYPKKVMDNNGAIHEGLVFSAGQDYYAIIVICHSSNATVKNFMKSYEIQNNVLQSVVNASTTPTYEARWFSVARDSSNQLHLVYKNWTDYINYCKWNTTSWNVQDTNIGYGSAYPVISCHKTINETYVNWVIDGDCYVNTMNASGWRGLERMHTLEGQKEYADPNHVIEQVDQYVLFAFNVYNFSDAATEIWSYRYSVTLVARITFTSIGSNSTVTSQPCLLYAYATESGGVGMSYANIRYYDGSTWDNNTFTALSASMAIWTNFTKTLPSSIIAIVQWQIYVNDTNGQWAYTAIQTITLTANLSFVLGDRLTIPITTAYLKALHAPINDALEIVTYEMLLKNILFNPTTNTRATGGTSTEKLLVNNFAETVKPSLTFDFLKLLNSPVTDVLATSAFLESWKTVSFSSFDTVKLYDSLSTTLNIPTYLTSVVSGLIPIRDSSTMTKAWINLFSETVKPNMDTMLLKSLLNPLGGSLPTLGSSGFSKTIPIQTSETFLLNFNALFSKAILSPLGSTVTVPTSIEATKTLIYNPSDILKPFDYITMTIGVAVAHVESFLGDILTLQGLLGATKNMVYLPTDVLEIAVGRYAPGLAIAEDLSTVWMVLGLVGFVLGLTSFVLYGKRRREE